MRRLTQDAYRVISRGERSESRGDSEALSTHVAGGVYSVLPFSRLGLNILKRYQITKLRQSITLCDRAPSVTHQLRVLPFFGVRAAAEKQKPGEWGWGARRARGWGNEDALSAYIQ